MPGISHAATTPASSEPAEASQETDPSSEEAPSATDPQARKALRSAFVRLIQANTGRFEVRVPLGSDLFIHQSGTYQIRPAAYDMLIEHSSDVGAVEFAYRAVGDEMWVRVMSASSGDNQQPKWPCWVNYDDLTRLGELPGELAQTSTGQPPPAVIAASYGIGRRFLTDGSVEGTTDLALALGLVSGKFLAATGVEAQGDAIVPATFFLDGGDFTGFSVPLAELPAAIASAGGDLPTGLEALDELPGAIVTRFSDYRTPVTIQAPAADEQLTFKSPEDFAAAMKSCGAG